MHHFFFLSDRSLEYNRLEFYRYVPSDWPPAQYFAMPGIKVDVSVTEHQNLKSLHPLIPAPSQPRPNRPFHLTDLTPVLDQLSAAFL